MVTTLATIGLFAVVCICADILTHPTSDAGPSCPARVGTSLHGGAGGEAQPAVQRRLDHPVFDLRVTSSDIEVAR